MNGASDVARDAGRRRRVVLALAAATLLLLALGALVGSEGYAWDDARRLWRDDAVRLLVTEIRLPRSLGAWCTGALLGLAGAMAQGLFRNPLADPYLVGSASGASLAVVLALAAQALGSGAAAGIASGWAEAMLGLGLVGAAFLGALGGVSLALLLARGAQETTRLLLAGVVVGVVLAALGDLVTLVAPETLRGRQTFLLGNTGQLGWTACALLGAVLVLCVPAAVRLARALDGLALGDDTARSLGLALGPLRAVFVGLIALATGAAVSQAGLIAFVGLAAPHLVRRLAPATSGHVLAASALAGGVLLLVADVLARALFAPREVPVGVVTALLGGAYLIVLLQRRDLG